MGNSVFYAILGLLQAVLVISLIVALARLIKKKANEEENYKRYMERMEKLRAERKAEEEKKKTHYSTYNETEQRATKWRHGRTYVDDDRYIPKYAAGDDMDRLKRPKRDYSGEGLYVTVVVIILACIRILSRMR